MKVFVAILLAMAILIPLMGSADAQADDGVEVADLRRRNGGLMAYRTRQLRAMRARQMQMLRMGAIQRKRRNRRSIPPWVYFNDEAKAEELIKEAEISKDDDAEEAASDDAEAPNDKGERKIELEDLQLWKSMDLNKDGKLTIAEYERFSRSAGAQNFVRNMKEHKAVEQWASKIGIDVAKAKAAMMLGANAQRRRSYLHRQRNARVLAHRRRHAIARRNQVAAHKRRQRRTNYWAKLGQQYYTAMKQSAGRRGGEL